MSNFGGDSSDMVTIQATDTLTHDEHDGRIILLDKSGTAVTLTLPDSEGSGCRFLFVVKTVNTSNYVVKVASSSDIIVGSITSVDPGANPDYYTPFAANGTNHDTITLNGTTQGGSVVGDWFELVDIIDGKWWVRGIVTASGNEATPFSSAV